MAYKSYQSFKLTPIWILIATNFLLFMATVIAPELRSLLGVQRAGFTAKPWTIVTSLFVHGGLWHIIANTVTLYFFGRYLSRLIGESKFLIIYFGGGILGSVFYILLGPPSVPTVGGRLSRRTQPTGVCVLNVVKTYT